MSVPDLAPDDDDDDDPADSASSHNIYLYVPLYVRHNNSRIAPSFFL